MKAESIYITTTLPYVNADPHIGFALELVHADILVRYLRSRGHQVFFNWGTDEHGAKIYRSALAAKKGPQAYVDEFAEKFRKLSPLLCISDSHFIRTTDPAHIASAQEFWRRAHSAGYIYKKHYLIKYCIGCELEKTDSELEEGKCTLHPNLDIETIEEENYFFKFSAFGDRLLALYRERSDFIVPEKRMREIVSFVEHGLEDFSISRLTEKMPWGVPVPGDPSQTMYVWFDALVNYISAIGWPGDTATFERWWPVVQFAGKDNLRQQAAMWQAMLVAVGLPTSRQIVIHGFITSGGQKMSKSLGNVIDPVTVVQEYGADALRYFLAREVQPFEDSDVTAERIMEAYNANLSNGIGNLASRIMKMATSYIEKAISIPTYEYPEEYQKLMEGYRFNEVADYVWDKIAVLDARIQETEPFKLVKTDTEVARKIVRELVAGLGEVAFLLGPIMPTTSAAIASAIAAHRLPGILFPRKK